MQPDLSQISLSSRDNGRLAVLLFAPKILLAVLQKSSRLFYKYRKNWMIWTHDYGYKKRPNDCSSRLGRVVRPEGIEPPTSWFEARRSVRLSYGRTDKDLPDDSYSVAHYSMGRAVVAR